MIKPMLISIIMDIIMSIITKMIIISIIRSIMNMMMLGIRISIWRIRSSKNKIIRRMELERKRETSITTRLISPITISMTISMTIPISSLFTTINRNIIPIKVIKFCFIGSSTLLKTSITKYLHDYIQTHFALL